MKTSAFGRDRRAAHNYYKAVILTQSPDILKYPQISNARLDRD